VDVVIAAESAGTGLLVAGAVLNEDGWRAFLIGTEGDIRDTWDLPGNPFLVHSLAVWKDTYWVTFCDQWSRPPPDGLLELVPGGKAVRRAEIPPTEEDGHVVVPWDAVLYFGPAGERIYCVPHECRHDGPCHYGYCYRNDKVVWREWGHWWFLPVPCGDYLIEQEFVVPDDHLSFTHDRSVVRRISDGVQVATVKTGPRSAVACAGPDEFLLNTGKSVIGLSLPGGRRRWSVPIPPQVGAVVQLARAGTCTIALTSRNAMISICQGSGPQMVTTITR
jgi:hypothetical protein